MKRTTVRFSWLNFSSHQFLVECEYIEYIFESPKWVISRIEPNYKPTEAEIKNIVARAPYALNSQYVALYFSDEHRKAIRELEIERFHLHLCEIEYKKVEGHLEKAKARINSITHEIKEKFKE
jgi:hypothetical protein